MPVKLLEYIHPFLAILGQPVGCHDPGPLENHVLGVVCVPEEFLVVDEESGLSGGQPN